jgi:hypothetical protein
VKHEVIAAAGVTSKMRRLVRLPLSARSPHRLAPRAREEADPSITQSLIQPRPGRLSQAWLTAGLCVAVRSHQSFDKPLAIASPLAKLSPVRRNRQRASRRLGRSER